MSRQKLFRHRFIFLRQHGTRGIDQRSATAYVGSRIFQYCLLDLRKLGNFFWVFIANIRLFPDDAQTGAGHIRHDQISSLLPGCMVLPAIGLSRANTGDPQTLSALFHQLQLMGMNIAGHDLPFIFHIHGKSKGFSAGCGANIQDPGLSIRGGHHSNKAGSSILHHKPALGKRRQALQITGPADFKAAGKPGMLFHRSTAAAQFLFQLFRCGFQGIGLYANVAFSWHTFFKYRQQLLGIISGDDFHQAFHFFITCKSLRK